MRDLYFWFSLAGWVAAGGLFGLLLIRRWVKVRDGKPATPADQT